MFQAVKNVSAKTRAKMAATWDKSRVLVRRGLLGAMVVVGSVTGYHQLTPKPSVPPQSGIISPQPLWSGKPGPMDWAKFGVQSPAPTPKTLTGPLPSKHASKRRQSAKKAKSKSSKQQASHVRGRAGSGTTVKVAGSASPKRFGPSTDQGMPIN